ncbi:hypothetical protein XENORESO_018672 [Xenotaenia resolanae]|uniref:Uncharacterized protein n=1 Tax=Xenotaenia resolanae TaxID=208358 RepID=A0ABV0WXG7_9TELE
MPPVLTCSRFCHGKAVSHRVEAAMLFMECRDKFLLEDTWMRSQPTHGVYQDATLLVQHRTLNSLLLPALSKLCTGRNIVLQRFFQLEMVLDVLKLSSPQLNP